jgi:arylsulfatase A-like enzyme
MFKAAGYRTALIGKWGLGEPGTTGIPNKQGFDYFFGFLNQHHAAEHYPEYLWRNETKIAFDRTQYAQDLLTADAVRYLEAGGSRPFFLDVSFTLPHAEFVAPEQDLAPFKGKFGDAADALTCEIVAAMITKLDRDVGQLIRLIESKGLERQTLIIFTSDNGPHNAGQRAKYFASAGSFRGIKGDVYEGGIRVPFIARWIGRVPEGRTSTFPIAFWDLLPTFAQLTESKLPRQAARSRPLYWELGSKKGGYQAVRDGVWKAVQQGPASDIEVYDLSRDPSERRDISRENVLVAARLAKMLEAEHVDSDEYPLQVLRSR